MRRVRLARSTIFYGGAVYLGIRRAGEAQRQVYPIGTRGLPSPGPLQHNSLVLTGLAALSNNADRHKYSSAHIGEECEGSFESR